MNRRGSQCFRGRAWSLLALVLAGCSGSSDGEQPVVPSDDHQHNVMVVDQGIDLEAADFRGKVVAAFTLDLREQGVRAR